jgi:hypothetical protein
VYNITRYDASLKSDWDGFVDQAKNGMFMFKRGYMDYHADRFKDHSLCIYRDGELFALMPACAKEQEFLSHAGLTFGGILSDSRMRTPYMLEICDTLRNYLQAQNFASCTYKAIPSIYHRYPAQEDSYALIRVGAQIAKCEVSSTIMRADSLPYSERRSRGIKKAQKAGITFAHSQEYKAYFTLVEKLLQEKHHSQATHTAEEMQLLAGRFPDNIALWIARNSEGTLLAGVIMYITSRVAHAQYIAASDEGKECGALDALFDHLITQVYAEKSYFDFGISTEAAGKVLNTGLITQKEEFGARAIVHQTFVWNLD